jgi:DNA-binding LytR/AlgR family response regulator
MSLRCIAIDDEPFALDLLADDIGKIPFLELVGQFSGPLAALELLRQEPVDLLFLDIQMPTLTGIQFLRTLSGSPTQRPPMVIFTTAYEQYAVESYELSVVDYLLKPIPFGRFLTAVNKAHDLHLLRYPSIEALITNALPAEESAMVVSPTVLPAAPDFFFIFSEYQQIKIFFGEVLYVEGLKDYVKIYTTQQPRPYLSRLTLKAIEAKLPAEVFCRVHKSFIVALGQISSFQRSRLFVGGAEIPIGSSYLAGFESRYGA